MKITMVKKLLAGGSFCEKCIQSEELLKKRDLWHRIDTVVTAAENDPASPGMELAEKHGVKLAPFYIVEHGNGTTDVYTSTMKLIKELLAGDNPAGRKGGSAAAHIISANNGYPDTFDPAAAERTLENAEPGVICAAALERFGASCAVAFSGAEDVVLIDLCFKTGLPFSVFSLDTGRLHPETYRFIDRVRVHYGIEIAMISPDSAVLEPFTASKGLFSFYTDGHKECCGIRKVAPLKRALSSYSAWMTGQRRDQSPSTRGDVPVVQEDPAFTGLNGSMLYKFNPMAGWTLNQVWEYIRSNDIPYNELHDRGYISIGCEPCTRPPGPGEHERAGRWWWEEETRRECGLHVT